MSLQIATGVVFMMTAFLITYTFHCTWVTSEAYSSPSIVLSARAGDGGRIIFDDFREAYYWLRHNTPEVNRFRCKCIIFHTIANKFAIKEIAKLKEFDLILRTVLLG